MSDQTPTNLPPIPQGLGFPIGGFPTRYMWVVGFKGPEPANDEKYKS